MQIIAHRKNTIEELCETPKGFGIEVDIRTFGDRLIIHHEPFTDGVDLKIWLEFYQHGTLILNVKEEGLEGTLLDLMDKRGIRNFFFLDQSFPFLIKWSQMGEKRCAVRFSEFESIETALALANKVDWVWVDCFTEIPLTRENAQQLRDANLRLCIVSPELQGRHGEIEITKMQNYLSKSDIIIDAVCTKYPETWKKFYDKIL